MVASIFKFVMINKIIFNPLWSLFMKKLVNLFKKPVVAAGVFGLMVAGNASANVDCLKFYAGAGLDYNTYSLGSEFKDMGTHKTKGMGLAIPVLGVKFHENFGLEAGYSFNKKFKFEHSRNDAGNVNKLVDTFNVKTKNVYLDLIGFMPIAEQFDLIGGIGLGRLMGKSNDIQRSTTPVAGGATTTKTVAAKVKNKTSWRVKLGAQYNVTNNFGVRALATYQNVGSKFEYEGKSSKLVKNMKSIGLAAIYTF